MKKLLLILLYLPMIGLGQNKYDIELKKEIIQEYLQLKFSNITLSNKAISDR